MSKRHPGRRRVAQTPEHEDDVFVAKVLEIANWSKANQQFLTVLGVVAVLGVAGFYYYGNYRQTMAQQAANELELIHQSVALQDLQGAKDQLILYLERFGNTPYVGEARMLLGELYLESGEPEQALAVLEPIAGSPRDPLELQAASLLAGAYEQEGRWDEAVATYLRIADRSDLDFQIRDALSAAARIRADRGETAQAAELYRRLLDDLAEDAPERGFFEMRLAELGEPI